MNLTSQIANHFRQVHFGGNWTSVNLKDQLKEINWQEATKKIGSLNSIASLVYHMNYYVSAVLKVLEGGLLDAHDKYSFDLQPINNEDDWQKLITKTFDDAERFAHLVEQLPEEKLAEDFSGNKYGNYYRNIHGIIEHCHYHLGQIVVPKKLITTS